MSTGLAPGLAHVRLGRFEALRRRPVLLFAAGLALLAGWMTSGSSREVWGRPVCLLLLADGSMLVSDDGGGKIWRITYSH